MVRGPARPLETLKGLTNLDTKDDVCSWNGQTSLRTFHVFCNETSEEVDLCWFYEGGEHPSGTIQPGSNLYVGTYTFHQWRVRSKSGRELGSYCGPSATVTVRPSGFTTTFNTLAGDEAPGTASTAIKTAKGKYELRGTTPHGMPIWAFDCVAQAAVERARHVVSCMLEGCPSPVLQRMLEQKAAVGIFGRDHVVSDLPPHSFMKYNSNRDLDTTARGLGGTPSVPVTSCGEENLTMEGDNLYPCQSILVHEFGHAVMNLGMGHDTRERLQAAYEAAVRDGLYPEGCYMIVNECEYWATGTEAWFESTIRVDVNGGVNTRPKAREHDPRLASILAEMYGDTPWRFHHDSPHPLSFHRRPLPATAAAPEANNAGTASAAAAAAPVAEPRSPSQHEAQTQVLAHVQPQPQAQTAAHQPPATMDVLTAAAAALSTIQPQGAGYGHASAPAGRWQMEPQQQPQALPVESVPRAVSSTAPAERLEPGYQEPMNRSAVVHVSVAVGPGAGGIRAAARRSSEASGGGGGVTAAAATGPADTLDSAAVVHADAGGLAGGLRSRAVGSGGGGGSRQSAAEPGGPGVVAAATGAVTAAPGTCSGGSAEDDGAGEDSGYAAPEGGGWTFFGLCPGARLRPAGPLVEPPRQSFEEGVPADMERMGMQLQGAAVGQGIENGTPGGAGDAGMRFAQAPGVMVVPMSDLEGEEPSAAALASRAAQSTFGNIMLHYGSAFPSVFSACMVKRGPKAKF